MAPTNGPGGSTPPDGPFAVILGTGQDGGYPQVGCKAACCSSPPPGSVSQLHPACIAICDPSTGSRWLIDCTPGFPGQLSMLERIAPGEAPGLILSHAHMGHYTGLVNLGNEVMATHRVPTYALPRMRSFLEANEPWKELTENENIELRAMAPGETFDLEGGVSVTPHLVPHRDENSETACFEVRGPRSSLLWLPDIDTWEGLQPGITELVGRVDRAYLDGTFFSPGELPGRDMSAISHPLILESIDLFSSLEEDTRRKISFIHLNHTNPAIHPESPEARTVEQAGHSIATEGDRIEL